MTRPARALVALLVAASLGVAGCSAGPADGGAATARTAAPPTPSPTRTAPADPLLLALGDSIAAGVGAGTTDAERERRGYVGRLARALRTDLDCGGAGGGCPGLTARNLAVPGATTRSLLDDQLPAALDLLSRRGDDVVAVTVTIGGNDLFTPVLDACVRRRQACPQTVEDSLAGAAQRLGAALEKLRAAVPPATPIAVTTYGNPLPSCILRGYADLGDAVLEGGSTPLTGRVELGFDDLVRAVSADVGVAVADVVGRLSATDWVGGLDCLHPGPTGHAVLARVTAAALAS